MLARALGVDLAGSDRRPTGMCLLSDSLECKTFIVFTNDEIEKAALSYSPDVIAIDAPLSIPKGRKSIEERADIHLRECDRDLLRMRIRFFPITLGPMRLLTKRGIALKETLEGNGFKVIEVYPGGAQDILGIKRKKSAGALVRGLRSLGIKGLRENMTGDELDAVTCAYVGMLYLKGDYIALGNPEEGTIIMPKV